ncbi:unnamed protein product [Trifolium pratense]|uniref:Uncharacterized protein n=1 Tax=Trifolium pratense TaxID=57577 RepID=A0ACB0KIQ2_TRIPR|nr:unnamed protein product [Trifolium pratense]
MEFTHLSLLALFFLTLIVGINGSKSGEEYWKSVWLNTPIPKALSDLLMSDSGTDMPIKGEEEKQYWTVFFEHDLYPGSRMSLATHKHSDLQPSRSRAEEPVEKASKPFETRKWLGKASQPFGIAAWRDQKTSDKASQPSGVYIWRDQETSEANQPFGINIWWDGKTNEKENQHFGFLIWQDKTTKVENKKPSQNFEAQTLDEKETHILHEYCGRPSAIGEDKHCASSLESMMDFAISKLGKNIKVVSSSFAQNQDEYVVEEVKKLGDKAVMCHRLNFHKVVFYCHQINATTTYMVPLVSSDGTKSKALTICHHDTRGMDPNMLYEVLKVKPGTIPVCHFIGNKAVAWVPNDDVSESDGHPCVI